MIILLVADDIDHLVNGEVFEAHFCRADVLCHIDRCAVTAQKEFLVESLVGEICPDGVVGFADE